jgi:chaperonin cofactor prefoldin
MVFDTSGRRKHVVRVVYAILALLMGASLFLVVGPVSIGSLFGSSGSTSSASKVLDEQAERTEAKLRRDPTNEALLLALARTRITAGNSLTEVNPETGVTLFTAEGRQELNQGVEAWTRYLRQAEQPNPSTALLVSRAYFGLAESGATLEEAVTNIEKAAKAQRIAAEAQPTVNSLTTLAIYEYYSGNFAAGDKATKEAEASAPAKAEAKKIGKQMAEYRQRGEAFQKQKKEAAKQEGAQRKEALENPLGGLGGGGSSLGE